VAREVVAVGAGAAEVLAEPTLGPRVITQGEATRTPLLGTEGQRHGQWRRAAFEPVKFFVLRRWTYDKVKK